MIHRLIIWTSMIAVLLLSWCSSISGGEKQITYDERFVITIPEEFTDIPPHLVENKQLINKIVLAYKITNAQWFDKNLIISKSVIAPNLDISQFRTLQSKKLQRILVGYQPEKVQNVSFSCEDQKINGLYVTFSLTDNTSSPAMQYYLAQYQYLYQNTGYILSYISDTEKDRNSIKESITNITCVPLISGSGTSTQ